MKQRLLSVAVCAALVACTASPPESTHACEFHMQEDVPVIAHENLPEPVELIEGSGVYTYPGLFTCEFEQDVIVPLVEALPAQYEVELVPAMMPPGLWGSTHWDPERERFVILISGLHTFAGQAIDTLIHEWAHVLCWDIPGPSHGSAWGVMYAEGYRLLIDES